MNELLELINGIGFALDTPGAYTRGLLAGRPGERVDGREMLESWGLVGSNQEGLDAEDVFGFGAEMLLDPLNLIGGGALKAAVGANKGIRAANSSSQAMRAAGAMPEEIARLTKIADESGPKRMYHGTKQEHLKVTDLDPQFAGTAHDSGFYGEGVYFTPKRDYASQYGPDSLLGPRSERGKGVVLEGFIDARNPYETTTRVDGPGGFLRELSEKYGETDIWGEIDTAPRWKREDLQTQGINRILSEHGHDGVIARNRHGNDEVVAFNQSQIYSPYIAPALQNEKSIAPYLAMLMGNNAAQTPYDLTQY